MGTLEESLVQYAAYHRDRRNIATHFVGIPMIVLASVIAGASVAIPLGSMEVTLAAALALFVAGWALQFLGHRYEGIKPAFFDDVRQLLVGPLFVCAEAFFLLGARRELRRRIEARVGPVVARRVPPLAGTGGS
jgi:uncharacterized membrane protein YGL010W